MRWIAALGLLFLITGLQSQTPPATDLFKNVRPDAMVVVRKHPTGADMVEISVLDGGYPDQLLRQRIDALGAQLRSEPRGVTIFRDDLGVADPSKAVLKGTFAVNGLSNPATGLYRVGPIAKALAGGVKGHKIKALSVIFEDMQPGPETLQGVRSDNALVQGLVHPGQIGIEYRIQLLTEDPAKILIPDGPSNVPPAVHRQERQPGFDWTLWGLLAVIGLALGALVYSLLVRPRPVARRR